MKNLVITTCINYSFEIFQRFIGSLFDSIDNVELVIFIGQEDINHILKLNNIYKNIKYFIVDNKNVHIVSFRFELYYDFLIKNKSNYQYIFMCDSRDVLFQKDIFQHPIISSNYDLYIFEEESKHITIDKCQFNSLYVTRSELPIESIVYNKPIICAGTILGTEKGILRYLEKFNLILNNEIPENIKSLYGVDAGINYKIIYNNLLNDINIYFSKNNEKLVYTMAFPIFLNIIDYNILLNKNKQICYDKDICYCVHQYDRLNDIIKKNISVKYNYLL